MFLGVGSYVPFKPSNPQINLQRRQELFCSSQDFGTKVLEFAKVLETNQISKTVQFRNSKSLKHGLIPAQHLARLFQHLAGGQEIRVVSDGNFFIGRNDEHL